MADKKANMPKIVRNIFGITTERSTFLLPGLDSAAIYLGQFASIVVGTNGAEFGIPGWTDDDTIFGIVTGFHKQGSLLPIWDEATISGAITAETGEIPLKYTFAATNDESNTTAKKEMVEILPIHSGDIIEVTLWGASTASIARGTTTAAGTTASSANIGVSMSVEATYPFALLESSAAVATANLDFITVELDGKKPANSKHQFVMPTRGLSSFRAAN